MAHKYVRTDGNDGHTGDADTSGAAWLTVKYGLAHISGGDTLHIGPGTFAEGNIYMAPAGSQVIPSGTAPAHTVVVGAGEGVTVIQGEFYLRSLNYIDFESFTVDSTGHTNSIGPQGDMTYVSFIDIESKNADDSNVLSDSVGGAMSHISWIRGSSHDSGQGGPSPGAPSHGFYWSNNSGHGFTDLLVDGAAIYNNHADSNSFGLQTYSGGLASPTNVTIRNCLVHDNSNGLMVGNGNGHLVYNSLIYNNGAGPGNGNGIEVGFGTSTDAKIYNNVFVDNPGEGIQVGAFGSVSNLAIVNNIFSGTTGYAIHVYGGSGHTASTNIFYNNGGTTTGSITLSGNITSDPLFLDEAGHDFHLTALSPGIGVATALPLVFTTDRDGVVRGSAWDIGPYEFESVIVVIAPRPAGGPTPPIRPATPLFPQVPLKMTDLRGWSRFGNAVRATLQKIVVDQDPPGPVTGILLTSVSGEGVKITWTPAKKAARYNIYRNSVNDTRTAVLIGDIAAAARMQFWDSTMDTTDDPLFYCIQAVNATNQPGPMSAMSSVAHP